MTEPELTARILHQGKALVRAIEALGTIDPSGPIERAAARLLLAACERHSWSNLGALEERRER
jgi:hypothetical protein